jgi:hypothetical protein
VAAPTVDVRPKLRHEEFCTPRPDADAPRIETFPYYADDPATGRSRVTHRITRCVECGATHYQQIGA